MNTFHRPPLWLLTFLIMFPQLVETIYSPALPGIATHRATPGDDGWTPVLRHGFPHGRCCH